MNFIRILRTIRPLKSMLLLGCFVLTVATLQAQQTTAKISVHLEQADLKEFVRQIEDQTDYSFIYSEDVVVHNKITIRVKDKTIEETLRQAFDKLPVKYKITGKHILLQPSRPQPQTRTRKFTISGYLTDRESQETLIGAGILEITSGRGATTNAYGFYTLTLPEGETHLGFSYLGYAPQMHSFTLTKDTVVNVRFKADNMLDEVTVVSDRVESGLMSAHTGSIDIPINHIKNTPVVLGEADVMKTIQLMPGVQSGVEGSSGLYVRGGSPDQNLVLLDGVSVYNIDHLLGFFSIFTPEAVKKVTLFKGSFPARFGGRLSSVVDVRTNDGDMNKYHGSLSVGLLTSKFNIEGPIVRNRTSFTMSLRRSYLDLLTSPFMNEESKYKYYFYDINAKVNHKFSDKNRIFLSLYHGRDFMNAKFKDDWGSGDGISLSTDKTGLEWGNSIASFRWNNVLNHKLFGNFTVSYSRYRMNSDGDSKYTTPHSHERYISNYHSGIKDLSAQIDFDYTPNPAHHIKLGGNYIFHQFEPEVMTSKISLAENGERRDTTYQSNTNMRIKAHELSVYLEDDIDLTDRLRSNIGFHLSAFSVQGKTYLSLQPRLSARYQWGRATVLKASYSLMTQYINLLTSGHISMPTDLWVPVTKNLKPMIANQYALGAYYAGIKGWELSVEGYYKSLSNILEYKDATRFIGSSSSWEEKIEMGKGRSFGVELMAQRTIGNTTGWLSYTWAKSDRKFARGGINNGERFPFKYDRRHHVNLTLNHKFSDRVDINATWLYASGNTATLAHQVTATIRPYSTVHIPGLFSYEQDKTDEYVESRNNFRLPSSHRLNIGVNFHKKTKHGMRTWNISVYNVYNSMTPTFVRIKYKTDTTFDATGQPILSETPVLKKLTILPCLPSVTYTYRF